MKNQAWTALSLTLLLLCKSVGVLAGFRQYWEVLGDLEAMSRGSGAVLSPLTSIGKSVEGRDVLAASLCSQPSSTPYSGTVLLLSAHHADEYYAVSALLSLVRRVAEEDSEEMRYLKQHRKLVYLKRRIVPVVNVDAYVEMSEAYNSTGQLPVYHKNRRPSPCLSPYP